MADLRARNAVKIVDPTTNANEAAVDANGNLQAILAANSGVDIGDVDITSMPGTAGEGAALPSSFVVIAGDDGTDTHPVQLDAAGNLKAILQANSGVDIGDVDVASLPSDTFAAEAAALGKGVLVQGDDGTDRTNVLVDTDGHLQVDVLSGAGSDAPSNPTVDTASSSGTAAGASANLDSSEITEAEKLWAADVSASVPFKFKIQKVENTVATDVTNLMFGRANETIRWTAPHRDFAAHAGASAGTDVFRVVATNMDNSQAADLHAAFYYST